MPNILSLDADELGDKILRDTKDIVGAEWDSFTDEERDLVTAVSKDAASLTLQAVAGKDVATEKAIADASIRNIRTAAAGAISGTIWKVVENILKVVVGGLKG